MAFAYVCNGFSKTKPWMQTGTRLRKINKYVLWRLFNCVDSDNIYIQIKYTIKNKYSPRPLHISFLIWAYYLI
ncbi:hypothetical protein DPQ25_00585 [Hydrogeniiclostridium mannosilyticum]|uniref:Uncharacterized protein n=1 Tax=Hydrogeniiclostridium mannosilyticum TaxID=2764322 RepID=A0A328UIF4_9FIRM|nr:hypothetical protein DPQ25_00585 [Hydrogeniiclostridium mannosilyticum]